MSSAPLLHQVRLIPVDLIRPGTQQARKHFDSAAMEELTASVRLSGVVQPIVVRTAPLGFELLAGERRWRASQAAGLHEIPAVIRNDLSDREAFVLGLIENLQREVLPPIDAAEGMRRLGKEFDLTHDEIGRRIGKSREFVTHYLRLLALNPEVAEMVNNGTLSMGHAKVLSALPHALQRQLAFHTIQDRLSVRALERLALRLKSGEAPKPGIAKDSDIARLEERISDHLGAAVVLATSAGGTSGKISITYSSLDELDGILERIGIKFD